MRTTSKLKILSLLLWSLGNSFIIYAQPDSNKYGLKVINDYQEYQQTIITDSSNILLNIKRVIPSILLDIKYATKDNFLGEAVYKHPLAFARKPVVEALIKVQSDLEKQGLGIKIWDAYRPYSVTEYFYLKTQDTVFVAVPWKGSRHNRGCAVDLTLVNLKSGKELEMPTPFDDFTDKAHPGYMNLPGNVLKDRDLLISVMKKYGFTVYPAEWWHFDYHGWEKYDLMDIPFEDLVAPKQ